MMASSTLLPPWIETPLIESANLSRAAGCRVFLKTEYLQPGGSFKSRGPGNVVYQHVLKDRKIKSGKALHFYCSSGGNAGLACVAAATSLGYPSSVVVPVTTKPRVIAQLKAAGATEVVQIGESWFYADQHLREVMIPSARDKGQEAVYVSPFEDPLIYEGNSRIVDEIREQLRHYNHTPGDEAGATPDAIICTVGGGGLLCGLQEGLLRHGEAWSSIPVVAVGTEGAAALATSLNAGHIVTLPRITSIATSLGAVRIGEKTWEVSQRPNLKSVVLSDADAAMGVWRFADDQRVLVEPACGVGLAVCYKRGMLEELLGSRFGPAAKVVVIVCGGVGMTTEIVQEYRETYGRVGRVEDEANGTVNGTVANGLGEGCNGYHG